MKIKTIFSKKFIPHWILGVLLLSLMISGILFFCKCPGTRKTFLFPSVEEDDYVIETRYLPKTQGKTLVTTYVEQTVLGSSIERTKMLFSPGTKVLSCIENDKCLYINLSSDVLAMGDNVIDIKDGVELLKKNVSHNFNKFKTIEVFVDGKHAY